MTDGITAAELTLFIKLGVKGIKCSCGKKFRDEKEFVEHFVASNQAVVRTQAHLDQIIGLIKEQTVDVLKSVNRGDIQP